MFLQIPDGPGDRHQVRTRTKGFRKLFLRLALGYFCVHSETDEFNLFAMGVNQDISGFNIFMNKSVLVERVEISASCSALLRKFSKDKDLQDWF